MKYIVYPLVLGFTLCAASARSQSDTMQVALTGSLTISGTQGLPSQHNQASGVASTTTGVSPDAEQLVRYIAACHDMAGVLVATTLTAFVFLLTRRPTTAVTAPKDHAAELRELMGPYSLLFSFILALACFIVFSVMTRVSKENLLVPPQTEFDSWLSPFQLLLMMLFVSMSYLAFGTYYLAREWLWLTGVPAEVSPDQLSIMRAVLYFAQFGPMFVFFYLALSVFTLWGHLFREFWIADVTYFAAIASLLLALVPKGRDPLTKFGANPTELMKSTLAVAFAFLLLQQLQNIMWGFKVLWVPLELFVVILRTLLVARVLVLMLRFMQTDFSEFEQALRPACKGGSAGTPRGEEALVN